MSLETSNVFVESSTNKTASLCNNSFLLFVVLNNWKKSWELSIFSPWLKLNAPASANRECLRKKASFFQSQILLLFLFPVEEIQQN